MTMSRKRRRAINERGHAHFPTFSCFRRTPLLTRNRSRLWVVDALDSLRQEQQIALWAYVIMPEHVHVLLASREPAYEMRRVLAAMKAPVSRKAKAYLEESENNIWLQRRGGHG